MDGAGERNRGTGGENRQHQRDWEKSLHVIKPFQRYSACSERLKYDAWRAVVQGDKWDAALQ
jgi:hypothetical protein